MRLKDKLEAGRFAILAEMEPPKGSDVSQMVANAARVKGDVDAFVVPEMSNAVMRLSAFGGAMILEAKGLETVMQVSCRDRNRLALQADLLAANACGIHNIMGVTGEDPSFGDHHEARAVYDIDLLQLLGAMQKLQAGRDMAGIDLEGAPQFLVGSTVNAGATGKALDLELEQMQKKIEAGARFFVTPPLFDPPSMDRFLQRSEGFGARILPTVLLLKSVGMARYIDRHLDNVHIPPSLISRIDGASDKVRECTRIAADLVRELKQRGFSGVVLATLGWERRLPDIVAALAG